MGEYTLFWDTSSQNSVTKLDQYCAFLKIIVLANGLLSEEKHVAWVLTTED